MNNHSSSESQKKRPKQAPNQREDRRDIGISNNNPTDKNTGREDKKATLQIKNQNTGSS
jgi:hypothetical protein